MNDLANRFLDDNGLVCVWPKKHAAKQVVLDYLATKFDSTRSYSEQEVNEVLKQWHTFADWPMLRRELVDNNYFTRDKNGYEYRKVIR